jgi:hypothetical protein
MTLIFSAGALGARREASSQAARGEDRPEPKQEPEDQFGRASRHVGSSAHHDRFARVGF